MGDGRLKFALQVTDDAGSVQVIKKSKTREVLEREAARLRQFCGNVTLEVVEVEAPAPSPGRKAQLAEILVEVERLANLTPEAGAPRLVRLLGEACLTLADRHTRGQVELLVRLSAAVGEEGER